MVNKKKTEKINKPKANPSLKKKQNKQILWAVVLMCSLILIIILVPFITKNFINKFTYTNLDWQKTKLGTDIYYSTRIPIADKQNKIIGSYTMNFKNDPRKLEKISTNITNDLVTFQKQKTVYLALNPTMENCGAKTTISLINLAGFLRDFANLNVSSAVTDKKYANDTKLNYVTCETNPKNTVLLINSGNETMIKKTSENCYELTYKNCEVFPVTERFMIEILKNYMAFFTKKDRSFLDIFK